MSILLDTHAADLVADLRTAVYRDGIAGIPGALPSAWADQLNDDFRIAFSLARSFEGGTVGRGPHRFYFAVHPQQVTGFVELVSHPAVRALCADMLGADYKIVELGFDVPLPGAVNQPWHRDFPMPEETLRDGRITSLAFNLTTVDVDPDMGPFEVAPGTYLDSSAAMTHGMFPEKSAYPRYDALGSRRFPRRGDMSVRTGLTIHRGTANVSDRPRAVLVLGATTRDTDTSVHLLRVTSNFERSVAADVRRNLELTVVDTLEPVVQGHDIEGLMMGG